MNLFWVILDIQGDTVMITMKTGLKEGRKYKKSIYTRCSPFILYYNLPSIEVLGDLPLLGGEPPLKQTPLTLKPTAKMEPNVSRLLANTLKY